MEAHAAALVTHTDVTARVDTMALVVNTGMPAYPIPALMEARAFAVVTCTDAAAQEDTMALVANTGMPAYPIPA